MRRLALIGVCLLGGCQSDCGVHPKNPEAKYALQFWSTNDHCWKAFHYYPDKDMASRDLSIVQSTAEWRHLEFLSGREEFWSKDVRLVPLDDVKEVASGEKK